MYNKVILIGRLVAAPELHKTSTDKSVARVTVAVNRRFCQCRCLGEIG